MQQEAGCLGAALREASGQSPDALNALNDKVRSLRNDIYSAIGGWGAGASVPQVDEQP